MFAVVDHTMSDALSVPPAAVPVSVPVVPPGCVVGLTEGFSSAAFALAFALAAVVIYDAMGVRAETGKQGAVLNQILREVLVEGKPITEDTLKELVGHTPLEVLGGIIVAVIMVLIMA